MSAPEAVNHPDHYGGSDNPYEAIKVIEAWELGFCLGNTIKYIARAGRKGEAVEDLRKAAWCGTPSSSNSIPSMPTWRESAFAATPRYLQK